MIKNFTQFLNEKRSNPDLNPKIPAYDDLKDFSNLSDCYISFTNIDKIGINPNSKWINTPIGIYTYPLKESWIKYDVDKTKDFIKYPFANKSPFIWLIKPKNPKKVLNLFTYTDSKLKSDVKKLIKMYPEKEDIILDYLELPTKPGYKIWNLTKELILNNEDDFTSNTSIKWNKLFRNLGYDGVSDNGSRGIIHPNEPLQAVFFSIESIDIVKKVLNKKYLTVTETNEILPKSSNDLLQIDIKDLLTNNDLWKPKALVYPLDLEYSKKICRMQKRVHELFPEFLKDNSSYVNTNIKNCEKVLDIKNSMGYKNFIVYVMNTLDLSKFDNITNFILESIKLPEFTNYKDVILDEDFIAGLGIDYIESNDTCLENIEFLKGKVE